MPAKRSRTTSSVAEAPALPPRRPGDRPWTDQQWRGITTVGHSLLVSAAAGSGKTAMLAERCAYLVCDAPEPCDVDELLVVTFTDAAAAEMKGRITEALRTRATQHGPGSRAAHQLKLIDAAHISTLHGFCSRVLRQHFHLVGLDPAFTILDGEEAKLLRIDVARALFADRYELDEAGEFQRFIDAYGDGDDERLVRLLVRAREMLTSLVQPGEWISHARQRLEEAATRPLQESELGRELHALIVRELDSMSDRCDRALQQIRRLGGFDKYLAVLEESRQIIAHWKKVLRQGGLEALKEESGFEFDRLPSVANSVPNKAIAKSAVDSVRDPMKSGTWRDLLRFSPDEWRDGIRAVLPHANIFLDLLKQFAHRYREAKDAVRALDFADLERFTLRVLRDTASRTPAPSSVALSFHRRFKHVLVDEYQDINEVQDAILTLVSRECVSHPPTVEANLFCVGDVKQSIYRFRLAEAGRFLQRQEQFRADGGQKSGEVVDLQKNFRSRSGLIDAINGVFTKLMSGEAVDIEYDATHELRAGAEYPAADGRCTFSGSPIEMHLLPAKLETSPDSAAAEEMPDCVDAGDDADLDRTEREAVLLARRIREMMGLEGGQPPYCVADGKNIRPMQFRDMVILLRAMKYKAGQYADVLQQHGIPVHSESGTGFFETTEVSDLLSLLSLLDNARQDVPLAAVLRSPLARMPEPENALARLRVAYPRTGGLAFHEAVRAYARDHDDELAAMLRDFLAELTRWRELAQRRPLADLISDIYDRSGYLAYCAGLPGSGEQRVANLLDLLDRARQFDSFHRQGLSRFLQFIDTLRDESDLGQPSIASEADDVVRIMTVHRSKGLEFPVVFLPDLGKTINMDDCHGTILFDRRGGLGMSVVDEVKKVRYPSLSSVLVRSRLRQQALAEEMRVLYVATTRAKEHLVLVGTAAADAFEKWRSRWADHTGPLPPDEVLGASNMLDWLGPVAASAGGESIIDVQTHSIDEVSAWRTHAKRRQILTPEQEKLSRLEPLDPSPPGDPAADDLVARLTASYAHEQFAQLNATAAMSEQAADNAPLAHPAKLAQPRLMLEAATLAANDVGTAVHLFLEHLEFSRCCDREDLSAQLADLLERKLISPAQADCIDLEAVAWLMQSSAGELLRNHAREVRREVPVYLTDSASAQSPDPQDQVMLRGRIDALIPLRDGSILIDYKTDRIAPANVPAHAEMYRPQVTAYRQAVEAITGKPVRKVLLAFLSPRIVHEM